MTCDFLWCRRANMELTVEQRYAEKFWFKLGKSASETFELIKQAYGDDALCRTKFLSGTKCLRKAGSSSKTARTDAQEAKVKEVLDSDRRLTIALINEIKRELKGHRFDSIEAVQASTTKSINTIPETDFQRAFNKWQMRRTKYIDAGGMYFED